MDQYFYDVVDSLSMEEMSVLGILYDNQATVTFKSMNTTDVAGRCSLSDATYRKIMYRLSGNRFIELVKMKRQHSMYITHYGIEALRKSLNEELGI